MIIYLKRIVRLLGYLIALSIIKLIRVFGIEVKFCKLLYQRIGHFCGDFILYEANQRIDSCKIRLFFLYDGYPANKQWEKIFIRNAYIVPKFFIKVVDFEKLAIKHNRLFLPTHFNNSTRDVTGVAHKVSKKSWLLECEKNQAKNILRNKGWSGQPIVTIHVRDNGYLLNNEVHKTAIQANWCYHSYRDSTIDSYSEVILNLIRLGYFVCRIGKNTNKRLPVINKSFIDCWHDNLRLDLIDIWLCLNSKLVVSTGSGIDSLAAYSGTPVCFINAMPIRDAWTFSNCLWVSKNCYWKESGKHLKFVEMIEHSYYRTELYEAAGISIEELSPQEITIAVQEALDRIDGNFVPSSIQSKIKSEYEKILRSLPDFDKQFGFIHPNFSFGLNWMQSKGEHFLSTGF